MAQDKESYIIPPKREPSYLNGSAAVGAVIGFATGLPFAPVVGGVIGSMVGKNKMEEQTANGIVVSPPSLANKGAMIGGASGFMTAGLVAGVGAVALTGGLGLLGVAGVALATGVGAMIGGKINKHFQEKAYRKAEKYVLENGNYVPPHEQAQAIARERNAPAQQQDPAVNSPAMDSPDRPQQHTGPANAAARQSAASEAGGQISAEQFEGLQELIKQGRSMENNAPPAPSHVDRAVAQGHGPANAEQDGGIVSKIKNVVGLGGKQAQL